MNKMLYGEIGRVESETVTRPVWKVVHEMNDTWAKGNPEDLADRAIVCYYFKVSVAQGHGLVDLRGQGMFFPVKKSGKWWAVADQFSPYPAAPPNQTCRNFVRNA